MQQVKLAEQEESSGKANPKLHPAIRQLRLPLVDRALQVKTLPGAMAVESAAECMPLGEVEPEEELVAIALIENDAVDAWVRQNENFVSSIGDAFAFSAGLELAAAESNDPRLKELRAIFHRMNELTLPLLYEQDETASKDWEELGAAANVLFHQLRADGSYATILAKLVERASTMRYPDDDADDAGDDDADDADDADADDADDAGYPVNDFHNMVLA